MMRRIGREKIRRITKKKLRDGNIRRIICTCIWKEYKDGRMNICKKNKKKKKMKTVTLVRKKYLLLRLRKRTKNEEENYFIPPLYRIYMHICIRGHIHNFHLRAFPQTHIQTSSLHFPECRDYEYDDNDFCIYLFIWWWLSPWRCWWRIPWMDNFLLTY